MMLIDLSVPLNEQTPVYPGDPAISITSASVLAKDGYNVHRVAFGTHAGTHIDAPMHMLEDGASLDEISVDRFAGRGRYVDVTCGDFDVVKHAGIRAGDIVLLHTGMADRFHDPVYFDEFPVMPDEIAEYLVNAEVKMVGVDACSVDSAAGFRVHKILLAGDVLIIENLTGLERLAGKEFRVYALPIKMNVDGAPARVVAETFG